MSIHTADVIPSVNFSKDDKGRILVTNEEMELLGKPIVNIDLTGQLTGDDFEDESIEIEKLADSVMNKLPQLEIVVGIQTGDEIEIDIQVQDAGGNDLPEPSAVLAWLSDAPYGGETVTLPGVNLDLTNGALIESGSAARARVATDTSGQVQFTINNAGGVAHDWYLNVELGGKLYVSDVISMT